ncbi:shikimate dehydrogenase [Campylobacter suis]|uniref:Shikimate dehydrogenase (NADP(+)) n=1 Tax=Campylobacter suis TaxID=2790657 RepID=A0ABM8Q711_9BACT|nr:shikimate dehydrogenase [Campylobacter suis]CAD7288582.1 Shikimate dehydrogenase (NADP(+)) [Campylobacter suis]
MRAFALFGDPVAHSISPRLHNKAISELDLNGFYSRILLKEGYKLISSFKQLRLDGANVTVPHKAYALHLADVASEEAMAIGSANTLVLKDDKIYAHNTDAPGFLRSIKEFKEVKSALIIGAGGTAKAIAYSLKNAGISVEILNRSKERFAEFNGYECFTWSDFKVKSFDLIINSTSAGLKDDSLPLSAEILTPCLQRSKFAYDVIYAKQTPFLKLAKSNGLLTKDGSDMLLFQAVLALNLFYDNKLNEEKIEFAMRKAMQI